ncbi:DUF4179 domain-containing protein [Paenibacillus ginsengarvi]|uniref:DUF4179 domain-containing protein n=1 Tax=Paenibacillus ginsengarvi TaxID=400777 RepID=A0A3B0CK22_9BACL|nr:DUF4179 domain-containing protein [Paenibacillus ginsengarvi]RKN85753.1 DUF4179 domain-containing protein [Paenibacillus ginsengarvi]
MDDMHKVEASLVPPGDIRIPEQAESYIRAGIAEGRTRRRRDRRLRAIARLAAYGAAAFLVLLIGLIGAIRLSPVLASGLSHIPLLQQLVEKVRADRSIQLAAQHDYVQHTSARAELDGIELTIDGIIADEWRVVLFYTVRFDETKYVDAQLGGFEFYDAQEERLTLDKRLPLIGRRTEAVWPPGADLMREGSTIQGKSEYRFHTPQRLPARIKLKAGMSAEPVQLGRSIPLLGEWIVELPVDQDKFYGERAVLPIEQTVTVGGQRIHFRQATLYPTVVQLDFEYDSANEKQIFGIDDWRLLDDTGQEWAQVKMDRFAPEYVSDEQTIYFESMYFETPRALTLSASRIRALEKQQRQISVDLTDKTLLRSPTDRLRLDAVDIVTSRFWPDAYELTFTMDKPDLPNNNAERPIILWPDRDAAGNRILWSGGQSGTHDGISRFVMKTKDTNLVSPLTFTIVDYGYDKIVEPFEVAIPLEGIGDR